jgi:hypothetical protein
MLDVLGPDRYRTAVALLPPLGVAAVGAATAVFGPAVARDGQGWQRIAAGLVPVSLATQLTLSLQHLAGSGWPTLQGLLIELLPLPWDGHLPPSDAYTVIPALKVAQFAVFAVAGAIAWRQTRERRKERAAGVAATAGFAGLFALPMSLAC